ncbi:MAG: flagellar hook capping protein, partial [Candidatus Margulisbacteria bacterium]|nr:flagellar hook capping protein [Candidatus Margulisiibacteriota bacterium]
SADYTAPSVYEDKSILAKDDFLKLLLVELQHQDPTEPMDSDKILTQTSQLATLEASDNTTKALEDLATALGTSQQFSMVSVIGKTADLGSNAIAHDKGSSSAFEVYFPEEIASGNVEILDSNGNTVQTLSVKANPAGVYQFDWDGTLSNGNAAESNMYYITSSYKNPEGKDLTTRLGAYPIESVRFENGQTLAKVGSSYVPLENIVEVY